MTTPEQKALAKQKKLLAFNAAMANASISRQKEEEKAEKRLTADIIRRDKHLEELQDLQYQRDTEYRALLKVEAKSYLPVEQQFQQPEAPKKRGPGRPKKVVEALQHVDINFENYIKMNMYGCWYSNVGPTPLVEPITKEYNPYTDSIRVYVALYELNDSPQYDNNRHFLSTYFFNHIKSMCSRAIIGDNYVHNAIRDIYFISKYDIMMNGPKFPLIDVRLNQIIVDYMLLGKFICFDSNHKMYYWVAFNSLFTLIEKPEFLYVFLSELTQHLSAQISKIDNTLRSIFTGHIQQGLKNFYNNYLSYLVENLNSYHALTKKISQSMIKDIHVSLSTQGHIKYKENIIEFLNEKGRPKYLPMKDGWVYNLTTKQFEVRQPYHAFLTSCNMLSTQFTKDELEWALKYYKEDNQNLFKWIISTICNDDPILIKKINYILGCALSGTPPKALIIIYSRHTNSGKTLLAKIIFMLLGNKAEAFDNGLVIDTGKKSHETEKALLAGLWAAIVDELPQEYTFSKDIQLYTSGAKNKIGARKAHMSYKELSLLLALIMVFTNYPSMESFRCVVVSLPCGFCHNPTTGPYPKSWIVRRDANGEPILLEELRKPGVIRQQVDGLEERLEYDHYEKLMMLVEVIKAAEWRIEMPEAASEQLVSDMPERSGIPVSIEAFLNLTPEDIYVVQNTTVRLNPYLDVADNRTPKKSLVSVSQYYESYRQFVKQRFDCRASSKLVLTRVLNDLGFMEDKDRTRFVKHDDPCVRRKMPISGIIKLIYQPLLITEDINKGVIKSEVHNKICNYIVDFNKRIEKGEEPGERELYYEPTISFIKSYIEKEHPDYIQGKDGKSGNHNYYHLREIDSIFNNI